LSSNSKNETDVVVKRKTTPQPESSLNNGKKQTLKNEKDSHSTSKKLNKTTHECSKSKSLKKTLWSSINNANSSTTTMTTTSKTTTLMPYLRDASSQQQQQQTCVPWNFNGTLPAAAANNIWPFPFHVDPAVAIIMQTCDPRFFPNHPQSNRWASLDLNSASLNDFIENTQHRSKLYPTTTRVFLFIFWIFFLLID